MLRSIQNWSFCANCIAWTYMRKRTISPDKVPSKLTGRSYRKYLPFSNTGILQDHFQFSFSISWRLSLLPTYRCFGNSYLKQITNNSYWVCPRNCPKSKQNKSYSSKTLRKKWRKHCGIQCSQLENSLKF